ncbi:hypothetical protein D1627_01960 [Pontibacter oryzae]|uniref:Uncharacterized protein n=1 Tax=Pontibacter oryzae TaxID=2304593 RepID=A0A399SJI1_9BACT|nr:hypothetical protein D1627_01960 [Pontibacter oryzae]
MLTLIVPLQQPYAYKKHKKSDIILAIYPATIRSINFASGLGYQAVLRAPKPCLQVRPLATSITLPLAARFLRVYFSFPKPNLI